jgi:hypothetical protein
MYIKVTEFMHCFVTPFILQQHQYCEICFQESSLLPNKSIARFSWKLKKEVRIKTHGLKHSFKVVWTIYVTCIGLFVVLPSVIILIPIVPVSLLLVLTQLEMFPYVVIRILNANMSLCVFLYVLLSAPCDDLSHCLRSSDSYTFYLIHVQM